MYVNTFPSAMDLSYGNLYCFSCKDYVYDSDFEEIAKSQRRRAVTSLGKVFILKVI